MQVLEHLYPNVVMLELTERLTVETEADLKDAVRRQLDAGGGIWCWTWRACPTWTAVALARWCRPMSPRIARVGR